MKKILILWALALSLASCMTEKKAERRMAHLAVGYPSVSAKLCANYIKETHISTIEYKEGKRDTLWQAEYVDCDTVIGSDRIVRVPYPVIIPSRDTIIYRDSIFQENTKHSEYLQGELKETTHKLYSTQETLKSTRGLCTILIAILATIGVFSYLKSKFPWNK